MPDPTDIEIAASVRADIAVVKAGASGAAHTLWINGRAYIISVEPSALNSPGVDTLARVVAGRTDQPTHTTPCPEWEPPDPSMCARCGTHMDDRPEETS